MKTLNVLLALLVSLAMGLGVLEIGLRVLGRGPERALVEFDEVTGWSNRPNASLERSTPEFKNRIETNAQGLRGDVLESLAKPSGVFRIVALGDSFTLGFAVDRADHFVDLLEAGQRAAGRPVEVLNVGVEGWDTAQQAAWLERNAALYEPDLVLLLPYENDLYWNSQASYAARNGVREKPRFNEDGTLEVRMLEEPAPEPWTAKFALTKWLDKGDPTAAEAHRMTVAGAAGPIEAELAPLLAAGSPELDATRAHTRGALRAIQTAAESVSAGLLIAPIPNAGLIDPHWRHVYDDFRGLEGVDWSPDRPVDFVMALAEELDIEAVDLRPALQAAADADGEAEPTAEQRLYRRTDFHLAPRGSRVVAAALSERLAEPIDGRVLPAADPSKATALAVAGKPSSGVPFWAKLFAGLWLGLTALYASTYRGEGVMLPALKVGGLLAVVFGTFLGLAKLQDVLPRSVGGALPLVFVAAVLGFVAYKLGDRLSTIGELLSSFIRRGHWYLMPLVVVLLSIGSLLVVAASSPLVAPFIYTLF